MPVSRRSLTAQERAELWRRWKQGQTLTQIGQALGKHAASVHSLLAKEGGIAPRERKRSVKLPRFDGHLTL